MVRVSFVHLIFHFSQTNGKNLFKKTSENLIYLYKPNIEKGIGFTIFCLKGRTVRTQKQSKFNVLFVFNFLSCFLFFFTILLMLHACGDFLQCHVLHLSVTFLAALKSIHTASIFVHQAAHCPAH